jgi:hypothetical protein
MSIVLPTRPKSHKHILHQFLLFYCLYFKKRLLVNLLFPFYTLIFQKHSLYINMHIFILLKFQDKLVALIKTVFKENKKRIY